MVYYHDTSQLCKFGLDDVSPKRMTTLTFILSELMVSDAISCPLCNSNTLWCINMTVYCYVEQVMTMCRVQESQLFNWNLLLQGA